MSDIIARWRDAISDPPEPERVVLLRDTCMGLITAKRVTEKNGSGKTHTVWRVSCYGQSGLDPQPGDQWLDITDVPAVPLSEIETLVTAAFIRRYPGGQPAPQEIPCHEERAPEPAEIEAQRTLLIEEMVDHGMHAEDAAQSVDGLIGVCQRGTVPLVKVQAAVDELWTDGHEHTVVTITEHTGITPSEVTP